MDNSSNIGPKSFQNQQKTAPDRYKYALWAFSALNRAQVGSRDDPGHLPGNPFGAFLVENGTPGGHFGSAGLQNPTKIALLGLDRRRVPRKMTSGRGFAKNIKIIPKIHESKPTLFD